MQTEKLSTTNASKRKQNRKDSHYQIEFTGAKNAEQRLNPQPSTLNPQPSTLNPQPSRVRRFRTLLLESLEQRRVFAVDFNSQAASHIDPTPLSNSAQATYAPFQLPTFDLEAAQSTQSGPISPALSASVANAVGLSEQTFAPESTLQAFQNAAPNLNSVQPMLVGSGFGSQPDWSKVTSTKSVRSLELDNSNRSQQVSNILAGGFAAALLPKKSGSQLAAPVASALSADEYRSMQPQFVTGSFCTEDGREVVVPRLGEGEPPANGEGDGNDEDEPFIPQVDVPDLQSSVGSPGSFVPADTSGSSTLMTLHGSFTASSLTDPDLDADGISWVHVVTTNWIDENTWSFTETLVLSYNLSASDNGSSDEEGDEDDEDDDTGSGDEPEDELQVTNTWTSSASATRQGFIMYTFTASRGMTTASAAGVAWSISISYSDAIHIEASASGGSSYTLGVPAGSGTGTGGCGTACQNDGGTGGGSGGSPGDESGGDGSAGDGDDDDLPENFQASANWDFSIALDAHSNGTFNVSSTPSLAIAAGIFGGIDRAISANIIYDSGGAVDVGSNWSSSSSSGNLVPVYGDDDPEGPCITCGGDDDNGTGDEPIDPPPFNPRGNFAGTGHQSASGGGSTGHLGGRVGGGLGMVGVLNNGKWKTLTGNAFDNFNADVHGDGHAKHGFVFQQDTKVTPIADGTNTTKVTVAYGWDSAGNDTATLDANGSVELSVKPDGEADTSDSTGSAILDGNGNGNGSDFMRIIASDVTNRAWDRPNQLSPMGYVSHDTGHLNTGDYLNYNSYNEGTGRDALHSAVNGTLQPTGNATYKIDASGNSILRVASDEDSALHSIGTRPDFPGVWESNSQGNDTQFTKLTNDYLVNGLITSTLQTDDSVVLSGGAHANDTSKIEYEKHGQGSNEALHSSGFHPTGSWVRDATFEATGTFNANYNAATDAYSESYSKSGDDEVQVTGNSTQTGVIQITDEPPIDGQPSTGPLSKTEYELLLEGIFASYEVDTGTGGGLGGGEGEGGMNVDGLVAEGLLAEGEDPPNGNSCRAGAMAGASGLYSTRRHEFAFKGALHMQSTFANATPGVGVVLGASDAINGEDSITGESMSPLQRGLAFLGFGGAIAGTLKAASMAGKVAKAADKVADCAPSSGIAGTRGLLHSFDSHATQWFARHGGTPSLANWQELVETASKSTKVVHWSTGADKTIGKLARIDGNNWFFVQYFKDGPRAGELATAFIPNADQLGAILRLLGK